MERHCIYPILKHGSNRDSNRLGSEEGDDDTEMTTAWSLKEAGEEVDHAMNPSNEVANKLKLVGDLDCPICFELMFVPIQLPCKHVLCSVCARKLSNSNSSCKCPICRSRSWFDPLFFPGMISLDTKLEIDQLSINCKYEKCKWSG